MFFSSDMLSKRGPLAKVWLAAHVERKVSKAQTLQTSIPSTVTVILEPASTTVSTPPLALRLSGQLLLGIARIYSKQAKYLLEDCSEASDKIRAAFRSDVVQALMVDPVGDDELFQVMPNAPNRDAINLRTTANRSLFEFELEHGDGDGYGFADGWEDFGQQIAPPAGTGRARIDADLGEITLTESMIHVGERSELGLEELGQEDVGLMGDGEGFELGLDVEGLEADLRQTRRPRERGLVGEEEIGDETMQMEVGRDAPGTADRRSARESLLPGQMGDISFDKSYDMASGAGDISFGIEGGEPSFEPIGLEGGDQTMDLGLDQPMDLGLEQGAPDVEMAGLQAQAEDGQATPRAATPVPAPLFDPLDVTPRTSHHLAPHLQSPTAATAGVEQQPPKKKKKHQLVDVVTELDPADQQPSSQRASLSQLTTLAKSRFLPKDRYQLQHYRLSLDPSRHEFLPKLLEANGQSWLMAAPAGLCKELQELFKFPAKASRERGAKRPRAEGEEEEELESEHGRRAPSMAVGEGDISRIDIGDGTFDLGVGGGEESGVMFGGDEEFRFELPEEQDRGSPAPGVPQHAEARSEVEVQTPARPPAPVRRPRAEGESSKLDIFDEPGDTQSQSQATELLELERNGGGKTKWSKNTVKALKVLKDELEVEDGRSRVMKFHEVSERATRKAAASFFFELLVLGTRDCLKLKQARAFGEIEVRSQDRLWEVLDQESLN